MSPIRLFVLIVASAGPAIAAHAQCSSTPGLTRVWSNGWGIDTQNRRFQDASVTSIDADNVDRLVLKWAFRLEGESPHAYPLVTEDTVFIGDETGMLHALDRSTGCERWSFQADQNIRTAVVFADVEAEPSATPLLFFGTQEGSVYAVNAASGEQVWRVRADSHDWTVVTGSPAYHDAVLYVPVSSHEVGAALLPLYECCTFRGSLLALDAATGVERWRTYTVQDEPAVTGRHFVFVDTYGPSGAPIWSAPTVDAGRRQIYVATGENYTHPTTDTSDAVIAMDLIDGHIVWHQQFTTGDAWNMACDVPGFGSNCPDNEGPDFDFGAPPILTRAADGSPILLAGQKSGFVHAMNPDNGAVLWQRRAGRGGKLGGIHWGMAVNERLGVVYVPVSDRETGPADTPAAPGLHAIDISSGDTRWSAINQLGCGDRAQCYPGVSAAVVATDDLVFAGGLDGRLQAYDARTGAVLWSYDTWRDFDAVNGGQANGGAFDVHGPILADDLLFVVSGYSGGFFQKGGNAFLAFQLE